MFIILLFASLYNWFRLFSEVFRFKNITGTGPTQEKYPQDRRHKKSSMHVFRAQPIFRSRRD